MKKKCPDFNLTLKITNSIIYAQSKVPQHAYVCTKYPNLERNPEVIEEIRGEITMPKVLYGGDDGITSINYFCEIQDVECLKDNGLFNYEARYCCEPFLEHTDNSWLGRSQIARRS